MFNIDFLKNMSNSLEKIALNKFSTLKKIRDYLNNLHNPIFVRMTGSGSALVSIIIQKNNVTYKNSLIKIIENTGISSKTI